MTHVVAVTAAAADVVPFVSAFTALPTDVFFSLFLWNFFIDFELVPKKSLQKHPFLKKIHHDNLYKFTALSPNISVFGRVGQKKVTAQCLSYHLRNIVKAQTHA